MLVLRPSRAAVSTRNTSSITQSFSLLNVLVHSLRMQVIATSGSNHVVVVACNVSLAMQIAFAERVVRLILIQVITVSGFSGAAAATRTV